MRERESERESQREGEREGRWRWKAAKEMQLVQMS